MGLYRKFCEADLAEMIHLRNCVKNQIAIRQLEQDSLYANLKGMTIFTIFFKEVKVLHEVIAWLDKQELVKESDDDMNDLENRVTRKIYSQLARHEIGVKKKKEDFRKSSLGESSSFVEKLNREEEDSIWELLKDFKVGDARRLFMKQFFERDRARADEDLGY